MRPIFAKGNKRTIEKLLKLRKQVRKDKAIRVAMRIQAIILSLEEYTTGEISRLLKVDRTTVPIWINNWNSFKEEGLYEGHRSGRKPKLSKDELTELYDIVESGPTAYGLNTGVWTSSIISKVIEDEFNVAYHIGHVWKILKAIGLSVQRPTLGLVNSDNKKKRKWTRYTYPNIKKRQKRTSNNCL